MTQSSVNRIARLDARHERQFYTECCLIADKLVDLIGLEQYVEFIEASPDNGAWDTWRDILQAAYDQAVNSRAAASVNQVHTDIVHQEVEAK